jgi:hypothetical protein
MILNRTRQGFGAVGTSAVQNGLFRNGWRHLLS